MAILVPPMLARLARAVPIGDYRYEPKWDGFRCMVASDGNGVRMQSRNGRPLARYFPELVEALAAFGDDDVTLDGELMVPSDGGFDFAALMLRLHPSERRVRELAERTPARFVAFDLIWRAGVDLRPTAFVDRRAALDDVLSVSPPAVASTPITDDVDVARAWLATSHGTGIDGVVAKHPTAPYEAGKRAMIKVKSERTLEAVVAGYRWMTERPAVGSLLLGLYDGRGDLRHIGVASSFSERDRERFLEELSPLATPLEAHPWAQGFAIDASPLGRLKGAAGRWTPDMAMDWVPIELTRVCEVVYDRFDGDRLRHPARFLRWRPDRDPRSCTFQQLVTVEPQPSTR
jgi:ATP-dependent DNA ligase